MNVLKRVRNFHDKNDCDQVLIDWFSQKNGDDTFYFCNDPPSSGIAPCVGTAGTVHDAYT